MIRLSVAAIALAATSACASEVRYRPMEAPPAPVAEVEAALYLVGDAGLDSPGRNAVLAHVRADLLRHLAEHPDARALVVFLGDNIYDVGARREFRDEDLSKLSAQVRAVVADDRVEGVFLPGNHDWGKGAALEDGQTAIEIQQRWIEEIEGARNVHFLPADGCPGPEAVHVGGDLHVVFIDTEWLLRRPESCRGLDGFYEDLAAMLARLRGSRVVITAHHPMATGGPHGGNVGLFEQGPVVYYLASKSGLSVQDLASGRYSDMLARLREAIGASGIRPLAMATGHDHSLQVIDLSGDDEPLYQLVSGSASKRSAVARIDGTRFASSAHGYMRMDVTPGEARVVVFAQPDAATDDAPLEPLFVCVLAEGATETCPEAPRLGEGR